MQGVFLFNHNPENKYGLINGNSTKEKRGGKKHPFIKTQRTFKPEFTKAYYSSSHSYDPEQSSNFSCQRVAKMSKIGNY